MGDKSIQMALPLDSDGFLRRECPSCKRQFKWFPSRSQDSESAEPIAETVAYYCPYCWEQAAPEVWWTTEQVEFASQIAMAEVMGPSLRRLTRSVSQLNRSGGLLRARLKSPSISRPESLVEPDDMVRVDFPCHPEEPLKVDEAWEGEVACLVCGIHYPFDLVRELPKTAEGERDDN